MNTEATPHHHLDISGQNLVGVEHDISVELSTAGGWSLTIEADFALVLPTGERLSTADGDEDRIVALLNNLIGRSIDTVNLTPTGELELSVSGHGLRVPGGDRFEAWNAVGPGGRRVVAMPGHEIAIWT